jgi:hypothetical protein
MSETEAETASRLGLARPWVSGPSVGHCPGSGEYGHGLTLTAVHGGGCCAAWNEARAQAAAPEREAEAG